MNFLQKLPCFEKVEEEDLRGLADFLDEESFGPGDLICEHGCF